MKKSVDYTGQTIGMWYFDNFAGNIPGIKTKLWNVHCINCGAKRIKQSDQAQRGVVCKTCRGLPFGYNGMKAMYRAYKKNAENDGKSFNIEIDDFWRLTSMICHYCRVSWSKVFTGRKKDEKDLWCQYRCNGLDRLNNAVGYELENVVACCFPCNRAKHMMSYNDFQEWLARVVKHSVFLETPFTLEQAEIGFVFAF